jgi:hypothetical protein
VRAGAFLLRSAYRFFPPGTIHVAVVDPGVGTDRALVAVRAGAYVFVGPDNGLLRWAVEDAAGVGEPAAPVPGAPAGPGWTAVRLESDAYRLPVVSHTFHGRDVIAPAAAHLAAGVPLERLGPRVAVLAGEPFPQPRRRAVPRGARGARGARGDQESEADLIGEVLYVDHFGNCITNLPPQPGTVAVGGRIVPRGRTYAAAAPAAPLALVGSAGLIELAVPGGRAADVLGIGAGTEVILQPKTGVCQ